MGQDSGSNIGASESHTQNLHSSTTTWTYKEGSVGGTAVTSVTCTTTCEVTAGSSTLTAEAADSLATWALVVPNAIIHLTCAGLGIGRYTVQTVTSDTSITLKEKVSSTCAAGTSMTITVDTSFFNVAADYTHVLSPGDRLWLAGAAEVDLVQWDAGSGTGSILMKWHDTSSSVESGTGATGTFSRRELGTTEKSEC